VSLGKSRKEVGPAIPHLVVIDGDEQVTPEGSTYRSGIGGLSCSREVVFWFLVQRGDHVNQLNKLQDALIADLESFHNQITNVTAIEYVAGDSDYDADDTVALRAGLFNVTYRRR